MGIDPFFANPAAKHCAVMAVGDWPPAAELAWDRFGSCAQAN